MKKYGVIFQAKRAGQKFDCINRDAEYDCPNESTLEAYFKHSENRISFVRCCTDDKCMKRAAELARLDG